MSVRIGTRAWSLVLALALLMAACGGGDDGQTADETQPEPAGTEQAADADCQPVETQASHHITAESAAHKGMQVLADEVEANTDGRVTIEIFSDGQLGGLAEMTENLRSGAVGVALIDSGSASQFAPELGVFNLPFLFEDMGDFNELMDGEVGEAVNTIIREDVEIEPLYWSAVGLRDMFFVETEVRSAADIQGLTMRVPEAPVWVDTFEALGTSPTAIPSGELYTALQTGVVDGFEFPLGTAVDLKMYEPVSVWTQTGHILTDTLIAASPSFVNELCEPDREALFAAADAAATETRDLWREDNENAEGVLSENLTVIDDPDLESFRDAVGPVHTAFTEENGSELYDMIQEALGG